MATKRMQGQKKSRRTNLNLAVTIQTFFSVVVTLTSTWLPEHWLYEECGWFNLQEVQTMQPLCRFVVGPECSMQVPHLIAILHPKITLAHDYVLTHEFSGKSWQVTLTLSDAASKPPSQVWGQETPTAAVQHPWFQS